jgi:hypothetical protein
VRTLDALTSAAKDKGVRALRSQLPSRLADRIADRAAGYRKKLEQWRLTSEGVRASRSGWGGRRVWSNNGAAGPHLDRGDAPSVQDDEPVAMPGPKDTVVLAEGRDHVIDHLGFADVVGSLKRHVYLFATNEPYA